MKKNLFYAVTLAAVFALGHLSARWQGTVVQAQAKPEKAAFLIAAPLEVWLLGRPFIPLLAGSMLVLLVMAAALRWWVISTLDGRWTTRIIVLPGVAPVTGGPYRFLRHPNYLAVILEIFSVPMIHTAWLTALVFSLTNAWMLRVRIRAEEVALSRLTAYGEAFAGRPRLVPGGR